MGLQENNGVDRFPEAICDGTGLSHHWFGQPDYFQHQQRPMELQKWECILKQMTDDGVAQVYPSEGSC